jgi:caffeoyl-CoA O-methyltransferase
MALDRESVGHALARWLDAHVMPDGVLAQMYDELGALPNAEMMTHPDLGRFLRVLVRATRATRIVEVGTFVGTSAIWMAQALPEDGQLDALDISEEHSAIAREWFARANLADRVTLHVAPASETLTRLEGPYDLAYIDADKPGYMQYFDAMAHLVRPGGVVVADNIFNRGRVAEPPLEGNARALNAFASRAMADPRFDTTLLTIGDGISFSVVRG